MAIPRDLILTTPRLVLRATTLADAPRMTQIQSNWNVTRMLRFPPWPASLAAMSEWVATHEGEWLAGTGYRFAVIHQGTMIGTADVDEIETGSPSLGYWFDEACWRRGFAREAGGALVRFTFETLGFGHMVSGCLAENVGSARVLERLGFRHVADGTRWVNPRQSEEPYRSYRLERAWLAGV